MSVTIGCKIAQEWLDRWMTESTIVLVNSMDIAIEEVELVSVIKATTVLLVTFVTQCIGSLETYVMNSLSVQMDPVTATTFETATIVRNSPAQSFTNTVRDVIKRVV
jgi:hypothetical protein